MTATTSTTIQGVSILSRQKKRGRDVFELALSRDGIEVRRPGRPAQRMSWDRVSEWEIEEREGYLLLTLRGHGAATPLVVPGWTLEDLEVLMRDVSSGGTASEPNVPEPIVTDSDQGRTGTAVAVVATPTPAPAPAPAPVQEAPEPVSDAPPTTSDAPAPAAVPTRAERRKRAAPGSWRRRLSWKVVVTVALLGILATAVILVLLQSAGVINWGFLGPVA